MRYSTLRTAMSNKDRLKLPMLMSGPRSSTGIESSRQMGQRLKKPVGRTCSAGVVGRQDDDDWRTVDVVEQERQTLVYSSPLGTVEL